MTKSYIVKIKAENEDEAKGCAELFTGDVQDISSPDDRKTFKFQIEDIDCKVNDVFEVMEIQ